jgi:nucleoside-diphosphate-sugar epimerase
MQEAIARNARIRDEGTRNLVQAAIAAGVPRMVAQSIAWAYAPGREPHVESAPLDTAADGSRGMTARGVSALEDRVLKSPPLAGIILRYGQIHGPGTGADAPRGPICLHVDAAAYAALLALDKGAPGAFNIAEPNAHVASDKARVELGWSPDVRLPLRLLHAEA